MTSPEANSADVAEQQQAVAPEEPVATPDLPLEVDERDAAEQAVVVEIDDDYRD